MLCPKADEDTGSDHNYIAGILLLIDADQMVFRVKLEHL